MSEWVKGYYTGLVACGLAVLLFDWLLPPTATPKAADLAPTIARLERLERWAEEREKAYTKCIAVEKMDLTIYPVPNVGVKKVSR